MCSDAHSVRLFVLRTMPSAMKAGFRRGNRRFGSLGLEKEAGVLPDWMIPLVACFGHKWAASVAIPRLKLLVSSFAFGMRLSLRAGSIAVRNLRRRSRRLSEAIRDFSEEYMADVKEY
jgi:hypothetical protein